MSKEKSALSKSPWPYIGYATLLFVIGLAIGLLVFGPDDPEPTPPPAPPGDPEPEDEDPLEELTDPLPPSEKGGDIK